MKFAQSKVTGLALALLLVGQLTGCDDAKQLTPTLLAERGDFVVELVAEGELAAVNSTPITPAGGGGRRRGATQTLAWIAPNHSQVAAGDVVARFNADNFQRDLADAQYQLEVLSMGLRDKDRQLNESLLDLDNQGEIVDLELAMSDQFNIDNELLYSRLELIDNLRNEEFLLAKDAFLERMGSHYEQKTQAELNVLDAQQQTHRVKLRRSQDGLNAIEVLAPHEGVLVYEKNWAGQEPRVGQQVFPGVKLASLPDLSQMQAKLHVPEAEAIGLATELDVSLVLEAYPGRAVNGKVVAVSHKAQPRERDNPVKFFTVDVLLDQADSSWLRPGQRVQARIAVAAAKNSISVPNQVLFQDEQGAWVYLRKRGTEFSRQQVTVGLRGPSRSQIVTGLDSGDEIALVEPAQS